MSYVCQLMYFTAALSYLATVLHQTRGTLRHHAFVWRDVLSSRMEELADGRTAHAQQGTDKREYPVVTFSWGALPFNESQFNRNTQRSVCLGGPSWWAINRSTLVTHIQLYIICSFTPFPYCSCPVLTCREEQKCSFTSQWKEIWANTEE